MNPFPQKLEIIRMKQKLNGGGKRKGRGPGKCMQRKAFKELVPPPHT